jgi:hypothetical protein
LDEAAVFGGSALIEVRLYPADSQPATALSRPEQALGMIVRADIPRGQALVAHYLYPDPAARPLDPSPYPVSPPGYRLTQAYGDFSEVVAENIDRIRRPARLAAGDRVAIIATTPPGPILQSQARLLLSGALMAEVSAAALHFSLPTEQAPLLQDYLSTGFPLTLVIIGAGELSNEPPLITWDYLLSRFDYPLLIPDGADLSALGD